MSARRTRSALFRDLSWDYLKKNLVLARVQSIMWPLMFLLVGFSLVITLYFGGVRVIDGRLTHRHADGVLRVSGHAHLADDCVRLGDQHSPAGRRVDGAAGEDHGHGAGDPGHGSDRHDHYRASRGTIEFRDVTFRHKDAPRPALEDITLTVPAGYDAGDRRVHRLGQEHAGEPDPPPVRCDGRGAADRRRGHQADSAGGASRSHIGYVPQETFLFSDTIAENITLRDGQRDRGARPRGGGDLADRQRCRGFPAGLRDHARRTGHHALRRAETAHEHRPGGDAEADDPDPR